MILIVIGKQRARERFPDQIVLCFVYDLRE